MTRVHIQVSPEKSRKKKGLGKMSREEQIAQIEEDKRVYFQNGGAILRVNWVGEPMYRYKPGPMPSHRIH